MALRKEEECVLNPSHEQLAV